MANVIKFFLEIDSAGHHLLIGGADNRLLIGAGRLATRYDLEGPPETSYVLVGASQKQYTLEGPPNIQYSLLGPSQEQFELEGSPQEDYVLTGA